MIRGNRNAKINGVSRKVSWKSIIWFLSKEARKVFMEKLFFKIVSEYSE